MNQVATASVEVPCDPGTAFTVFTKDIGAWWKRGTRYWNDSDRGLELRFEPYVGGRLVEVYDAGAGFELGRVTVWEPGSLLGFTWRTDSWPEAVSTDVAVRFTATAGGCLVTIEHTGWERLGEVGVRTGAGYGRGWAELLGFYSTSHWER